MLLILANRHTHLFSNTNFSLFYRYFNVWRMLLDHEIASTQVSLDAMRNKNFSSDEKDELDLDLSGVSHFHYTAGTEPVHKLFRECIKAVADSIDDLQRVKILYVDWVATSLYGRVEEIRHVCDFVLNNNPPASLPLLMKVLDVERSFAKTNNLVSFRYPGLSKGDSANRLRRLYEKGIREINSVKEDPDFWLSFVEMELKYGDQDRMKKVTWRAQKDLSNEARAQFTAELADLMQQ